MWKLSNNLETFLEPKVIRGYLPAWNYPLPGCWLQASWAHWLDPFCHTQPMVLHPLGLHPWSLPPFTYFPESCLSACSPSSQHSQQKHFQGVHESRTFWENWRQSLWWLRGQGVTEIRVGTREMLNHYCPHASVLKTEGLKSELQIQILKCTNIYSPNQKF